MAGNFATLAALRIGVGIGESSASPAAYSLLGDLFPPRRRATAVALYSGGIYIGIGLGIFLGGWVVEGWNTLYPEGDAPFGLAAWQVAFFVVGTPGLLMAGWVWMLREPVRGQQEGMVHGEVSVRPWHVLRVELMSVLPPLTLYSLSGAGATAVGLLVNLLIGVACAVAAWAAIHWFGSPAQWIALGIGAYSFASWVQSLSLRDSVAFTMIYRSRTVLYGTIGFGWIAFVAYGVSFWGPPFFLRMHGVTPGTGGTVLGLCAAVGGWLGVTIGGVLSDRMKVGNPRARPMMGMLSALLTIPAGMLFVTATNVYVAYVSYFLFQVVGSAWIGPAVALAGELVLPRMRATASAFYILSVTFMGLALGPYTIGQVSDRLHAVGYEPAQALQWAILSALLSHHSGRRLLTAKLLLRRTRRTTSPGASRCGRGTLIDRA